MIRVVGLVLCGALIGLTAGCSQTGEKAQESGEAVQEEAYEAGGTDQTASGEAMMVSVGCGSCIYKMEGVQGCQVAAMVDGEPMLLAGVGVDPHAHGLCEGAKQASVTGGVVEGRFVASNVEIQ